MADYVKKLPSRSTSERGYDGHKRVYGGKRHLLVDSLGMLITCLVTPANQFDAHIGETMMHEEGVWVMLPKVRTLHADSAYTSLKVPDHVEIVCGRNPTSEFFPQPLRWKVKRSFSRLNPFRRTARDHESLRETSQAVIKFAFIHRLVKNLVQEA